ncbi:O-antigen ligase family protein [Carnimonas nigrificans]|uniref:O-antigen ligase family protein n=1 Tax=Carnimonas nigrificans TaxID=64323 RepID=UPI00046E9665|nr:O-antigen ligase family protein [Carnimonas nigrificans]
MSEQRYLFNREKGIERFNFFLLAGLVFFASGIFKPELIAYQGMQYAIILFCMLALLIINIDVEHYPIRPVVVLGVMIIISGIHGFLNDGNTHMLIKGVIFTLMVCMTAAISTKLRFETIINALFAGAAVLLLFNILLCLWYPALGVDHGKFYGSWEGVFDQKNILGRLTVFATITALMRTICLKKGYLVTIIIVALAIWCCLNSDSRTSLMLCFLSVVIFAFVQMCQLLAAFKNWFSNQFVLLSLLLLVVCLGAIAALSTPYNLQTGYDGIILFGKHISLTGRLTIWAYALSHLADHSLLFGYGLDGFWTPRHFEEYGAIFPTNNFYPNDSHNGLVDLMVNMGVIGGALYIGILVSLMVWATPVRSIIDRKINMCFFLFLIIYVCGNITESDILKSTSVLNVVFFIMIFKFFSKENLMLHRQSTP